MKKALVICLLMIFCFLVFMPFAWMISTSFKPITEVSQSPPRWFTPHMNLQPYREMFRMLPFSTYTLNSLIVACGTTLLSLLIGSLAAYAFARFQFKGKKLFLLTMLLSQMLPGSSIIIPLFQLVRTFGFYDSHFGLILIHTTLILPFVIWLLYGFFKAVPEEVEDAAQIDGCSRLMVLWKICLPLVLPGLGATAIFAFLGSWNEFLFAMILTSSDAVRTIPVGIGMFIGEYSDMWNQMAAAAVFFSLPPLLLFSFLQRTFIKGLSAGAIK